MRATFCLAAVMLITADAAIATPTQVVVIDGKRIANRPISLYWEAVSGPYSQVTNFYSNDADLLVIAQMAGWRWPISRKAVSAAMHDVRCNPSTSSFREVTSQSDPTTKWLAANAVVRSMPLYTGSRAKRNDYIEVVWADWGTSKYHIADPTLTDAIPSQVPVSETLPSNGVGVVAPNQNCPNAS